MDEIHELRDVADMIGTHLADENLIDRLQIFPDRAGNAHRGIVAGRRHETAELLREHCLHRILRAGLAIGPGDADADHRIVFGQLLLGIIDIPLLDCVLDRGRDQRHREDQQPWSEVGHCQHQPRVEPPVADQQDDLDHCVQNGKHRNLALHTVRIDKRLDVLLLLLSAKQHDCKGCGNQDAYDQHCFGGKLHAGEGNCNNDQGGNQCPSSSSFEVFFDPADIAAEFIAILLKHMQRMLGWHQGCQDDSQKVQQFSNGFDHAWSSFRKISSTRVKRSG